MFVDAGQGCSQTFRGTEELAMVGVGEREESDTG